jgi:UDP-N-acetylmuramoylalanine--D-glutamate ligase
VLASVSIAVLFKIKPAIIRKTILSFKAPAHRLEYLGEVSGAKVFDDSKATNVSACTSAINSLGENGLVLLVGGLNKDDTFDKIFNKGLNFENILCFGNAGQEIFDCAKKYGYQPLLFYSMKDASCYARKNARKGQKILLSPACASFDEFSSYSERGEIFKEIMFEKIEKILLQ